MTLGSTSAQVDAKQVKADFLGLSPDARNEITTRLNLGPGVDIEDCEVPVATVGALCRTYLSLEKSKEKLLLLECQ